MPMVYRGSVLSSSHVVFRGEEEGAAFIVAGAKGFISQEDEPYALYGSNI